MFLWMNFGSFFLSRGIILLRSTVMYGQDPLPRYYPYSRKSREKEHGHISLPFVLHCLYMIGSGKEMQEKAAMTPSQLLKSLLDRCVRRKRPLRTQAEIRADILAEREIIGRFIAARMTRGNIAISRGNFLTRKGLERRRRS